MLLAGRLAQNSPQLLALLVQRNDGNRHSISTPRRDTIQGRLAVLARRLLSWTERHIVHMRLLHLSFPVHGVP
jgi:hypothetical protein